MKRRYLALALVLTLSLTLLCSCNQQPKQPAEGTTSPSAAAGQGISAPQPESPKAVVIDACSEEGSYVDMNGTEIEYSYHIPQINLDAPGATEINEEIQAFCAGPVQNALNSRDKEEYPDCMSVSYKYFQNGSVLSLVIGIVWYFSYSEEYTVYNYDIQRDELLEQSDMTALLGVSGEKIQNTVTRAAAQKFDEAYLPIWVEWGFSESPGLYQVMRAETLSENYLSETQVYLAEEGQPRAILSLWSFAGPGAACVDLPLEFSPGKAETLEDPLLDVSWNNSGVTLRFHGAQENRAFWEERFDCGWDLEYDTDIPVQGLYSNYTGAAIHMKNVTDPPILFLLTDQGRVEYIDLVSCIRGGYFCGGGPLVEVADVTGFTGAPESGYGGSYCFAACKDGSTVDLADALAKERLELPYDLADEMACNWEGTVTYQTGGGSYEDYCLLMLQRDGQVSMQNSDFGDGVTLFYQGTLTLLGVTGDGLVYYYDLAPGGDGYDGISYVGVSAFRTGYDMETMERVLYVTTLGASGMVLFDETPGAVTRLQGAAMG